jgi:hypothetical protein
MLIYKPTTMFTIDAANRDQDCSHIRSLDNGFMTSGVALMADNTNTVTVKNLDADKKANHLMCMAMCATKSTVF